MVGFLFGFPLRPTESKNKGYPEKSQTVFSFLRARGGVSPLEPLNRGQPLAELGVILGFPVVSNRKQKA